MSHFLKDYTFGLQKQEALLPLLEGHFKDNLLPTLGRFAPYDYEGDTASYELKSRTNTYTAYPTTCIGQDKINPTHTKKQVYIFNYTDGTYFIEYSKELFETFEVKPFRRWRDDWKDKEKPYVYIPIDKLTRIVVWTWWWTVLR